MVGDKKATEDAIKKTEINFMLDLKTLIPKSATDAELNRVRDAMRQAKKYSPRETYRPAFEKVSKKWGLTFNEDWIIVPTELRRRLLDTLHFGLAGATKKTVGAKVFWWPKMSKEIKEKTKICLGCMASGKNLSNTEK